MKAIFRTRKGNITIEEMRDIPDRTQTYLLPVRSVADVWKSGAVNPFAMVTGQIITYTQVGLSMDGTPIYEN